MTALGWIDMAMIGIVLAAAIGGALVVLAALAIMACLADLNQTTEEDERRQFMQSTDTNMKRQSAFIAYYLKGEEHAQMVIDTVLTNLQDKLIFNHNGSELKQMADREARKVAA